MSHDARKVSSITKLVGEDINLGISFEDDLLGRTISSTSRTTYDAVLNVVDNSVTPSNPTFSGFLLSLRIVGGTRGQRFRSYVYATLNTSEIIGHLVEVEIV